jgi:hypothetical protein
MAPEDAAAEILKHPGEAWRLFGLAPRLIARIEELKAALAALKE